MRRVLDDIRDGTHARKWIAEYRNGAPNLYAQRAREQSSRIEDVGRALRRMMPWLPKREVPTQDAPRQRTAEAVAAAK
jgi:ketol-acid reductoisomerase